MNLAHVSASVCMCVRVCVLGLSIITLKSVPDEDPDLFLS